MVNDMYTAIAKKLETVFDNPRVYFDELPQTFENRCFWVRMLKSQLEHLLHNRYKLLMTFDVMYYPEETENPLQELNSVAHEMMYNLEYVEMQEALHRGIDISYEIQNGALHLFVTYQVFVRLPNDRGEAMQRLFQIYRYKE